MSFLSIVGVIVLAVLLFDTRARLKHVEAKLAERPEWDRAPVVADEPKPAVAPQPAKAARIVMDVPPPTPAVETSIEAPAPPPQPQPARKGWSFEELFGGKLPIWAGGVTLAVAGVLLVKYSIDLGLLSPAVRVFLGLAFGALLLGGAEWALRAQEKVADVRVHQALAGAGLASLYAAILAAANLYGLIGGGMAFAGLAAVTALAMALSLRFGAPSAVLGLAGGLAAPALVQAGPPNVPLLCAYLALAIGSLTALSRRQRWLWLGVAALIGGAGWSALLILTGALDVAGTLSVGMLAMLLGLALPMLVLADDLAARAVRAGGALVAAAQIAAIVATGGFGALQWGLYLLLSAAVVWLADRERSLRSLPAVGLAVGLALAAFWPDPAPGRFALVVGALGLIHGAGALRRLWQADGSLVEAGQIAGGTVALWLITLGKFHDFDGRSSAFALLALAMALVPASAAAFGWRSAPRGQDSRFAILAFGTALLVVGAIVIGLPYIYFALTAAAALLLTAEGARRGFGTAMRPTLALFATLVLLSAAGPLIDWLERAVPALTGDPLFASGLPEPLDAVRMLALPALLAALALWRAGAIVPVRARRAGIAAIGLLGIVAVHSLYRRLVFGLSTPLGLFQWGLADRILWEGLVMAAGVALWRFTGWRRPALALVATALAHSLWFDLGVLNPLWAQVTVGPWPLANLLLPAFAIPFAGLWAIERLFPPIPHRFLDGGRMILTILLAYSLLRQLFAGTLLAGAPVSETENIGQSVLAIALAITFLVWGMRRAAHDWRIASLLLMLAAVAKVFLFDASGLTGLLRIASFLALGFSLIGIGWLYSRFLKRQDD